MKIFDFFMLNGFKVANRSDFDGFLMELYKRLYQVLEIVALEGK